jgi:hypothetical protein
VTAAPIVPRAQEFGDAGIVLRDGIYVHPVCEIGMQVIHSIGFYFGLEHTTRMLGFVTLAFAFT